MTTPAQIIQTAARAFGVPVAAILSRKRDEPTAAARAAAMTVIREKCKLSTRDIGNIFHRSHADITHNVRNVKDWSSADLKFKATFHALLAGVVIPYRIPKAPKCKTVEKTDALPKQNRFNAKGAGIELGLDILSHHVRLGQIVTSTTIAAYCGVSRSAIFQIEQKALRKIRERLRIKLRMDHGQLAISDHHDL